jgi:hypothetical protein
VKMPRSCNCICSSPSPPLPSTSRTVAWPPTRLDARLCSASQPSVSFVPMAAGRATAGAEHASARPRSPTPLLAAALEGHPEALEQALAAEEAAIAEAAVAAAVAGHVSLGVSLLDRLSPATASAADAVPSGSSAGGSATEGARAAAH